MFSHPDMRRCRQHTELRLWFKSKVYLPRTERVGKKYWSNTDEQVAICLQTWPEPAVPVEGMGKLANEKMFLTFTWSLLCLEL